MAYPRHQGKFQCMGKGSMAYIMQQYCSQQSLFFLFGDEDLFKSQHLYRLSHQMHTAQSMVESGMVSTWVYQIGKAHLGNTTKSLKVGMGDQIKNKFIGSSNKTINWIVEYFKFVG